MPEHSWPSPSALPSCLGLPPSPFLTFLPHLSQIPSCLIPIFLYFPPPCISFSSSPPQLPFSLSFLPFLLLPSFLPSCFFLSPLTILIQQWQCQIWVRTLGKSQLALFSPSNNLKPTDPSLFTRHSSQTSLCPIVAMSWHNEGVGNGKGAVSIHEIGGAVSGGGAKVTQTREEMKGESYQRGGTLVCRNRKKAQRLEYQKKPNSSPRSSTY